MPNSFFESSLVFPVSHKLIGGELNSFKGCSEEILMYGIGVRDFDVWYRSYLTIHVFLVFVNLFTFKFIDICIYICVCVCVCVCFLLFLLVFFFSYLLHMSLNLFNLSIYPYVCMFFAVCWVGPKPYIKIKCFVSYSFDSVNGTNKSKKGHL